MGLCSSGLTLWAGLMVDPCDTGRRVNSGGTAEGGNRAETEERTNGAL